MIFHNLILIMTNTSIIEYIDIYSPHIILNFPNNIKFTGKKLINRNFEKKRIFVTYTKYTFSKIIYRTVKHFDIHGNELYDICL